MPENTEEYMLLHSGFSRELDVSEHNGTEVKKLGIFGFRENFKKPAKTSTFR